MYEHLREGFVLLAAAVERRYSLEHAAVLPTPRAAVPEAVLVDPGLDVFRRAYVERPRVLKLQHVHARGLRHDGDGALHASPSTVAAEHE